MIATPRSHTVRFLRATAFIGATCVTVLGAGCSSGSSSESASGPLASGGSVAGVGGSGNGPGGQMGQSGGAPNVSSGGASGTSGASAGSTGGTGIGGATGGASSGGASGSSSSTGGAAADGGACCATKDCQPATVQACVCTDWHQTQCCTGPWDAICQTTAEAKCGAPHCSSDPATDPTKGACCAAHASGGCTDKATETCVCGLLPDCCDKAWDAVCVQLVREEHCEAGVRDCVCTTWQQSACCDSSWTDVCGIVAEDKCGAKAGCP